MSANDLRTTAIANDEDELEERAELECLETAATDERRPLEEWAKGTRTKASEVLVIRMLRQWPIGRYVTKGEFLAAKEAASNVQIR